MLISVVAADAMVFKIPGHQHPQNDHNTDSVPIVLNLIHKIFLLLIRIHSGHKMHIEKKDCPLSECKA